MRGLDIHDVTISRGRNTIVRQVTLELSPGQIVGIVGPNGAGKSTLLHAVGGLLPFDGQIQWRGKPMDFRKVGFMPQHFTVHADLSVLETVLLGLHAELGWRIQDGQTQAAKRILESFGVAHLAARSMQTLSGGQQQLVLLAQRLVRQPDILILDEATSALDLRHQLQVFTLLARYVEETGALMMVAIHDLNLAARYAENIVILHDGAVAASGRFETVMTENILRRVYGIEAELLASATGIPVILPLSIHQPGSSH